MSILGILVLTTFANIVGTGLFLWIGARWVKIPDASLVRCFWTTLVAAIGSSAVCGACMLASSRSYVSPIPALGLAVAATLLVSWLITMVLLRTSFVRAVVSSLPTLVPDIAGAVVLWASLASYASATHGMAPTLLGFHRQGICPYCGQMANVAADPASAERVGWKQPVGICGTCRLSIEQLDAHPQVHSPDRYLVNKWAMPRRGDIVVYRSDDDPKIRYVSRLIALPGEEIVMENGGVRIVRGTTDSTPPDFRLKLGVDECIVLNDFPSRSNDPQTWSRISIQNIEGVVGMIISPLSRIRTIP